MFSTLLGALPADPDRAPGLGDAGEMRRDDVAALCAAGLELVSDGSGPIGPDRTADEVVAWWRASAANAAAPVKAVLLGPFSAAGADGADADPAKAAAAGALDLAERQHETILALAAAGCAFVEIAEPDALAIATDPAAAGRFAAAHARLVTGAEGTHCSLALTGGNVDGAPAATFFDLAYASFAFDLIAGPDNWRLITQAPADRGIVCGALALAARADETREPLVWAAHYAASTNGRGLARVGLANAPMAPGAATLTRADALRKVAIVAEASRIAGVESGEEMARHLDPRAIDSRSAALGRFARARRRRP